MSSIKSESESGAGDSIGFVGDGDDDVSTFLTHPVPLAFAQVEKRIERESESERKSLLRQRISIRAAAMASSTCQFCMQLCQENPPEGKLLLHRY